MEPSEIHQETKGQSENSDTISSLPQDIIEKILSHMPIRDALRTSILSKNWRYCWTSMPKLVFDDKMVNARYDKKHKVVSAIFHVLLLHRGPILEFSLLVKEYDYSEADLDLIILHLLRSKNNIKKFVFDIDSPDDYYKLPCSFFSLQGLEHLDLSYCVFDRPLMNKGFSMLKSLSFFLVDITNEMIFELLTDCPLLEEFTWFKCELPEGIELTECELVELFKCLPSIQVLEISKLNIKHLAADSMPHKLPISLLHLRTLDLEVCFLEISIVLCLVNSSPNLEKIKIELCWNHDRFCRQQTFNNMLDPQDYSDLNLDHLKEMEIECFRDCGSWIEFVKLVIAKSPVLKKARIELDFNVSVDEEVKMLRDLPSPACKFIMERRKR